MSKKKKEKQKETTIEDYYDLRQGAVDELVEALKTGESKEEVTTNIAEITGEDTGAKPGSKKAEFDPYKRDKLSALPVWFKALGIKWWFAGLTCYFVFMGLGNYVTDALDIIVLGGVVLGALTDFMVNPILRFMESDRKEYNNYMMFPFPFKAFWTFFANIVYYVLVMAPVVGFYEGLNRLIDLIAGSSSDTVYVAVGPLLFGVVAVIADMAFIGIKDGIVYGVKKAKRKKAAAAAASETPAPEPAEEEVTPAAIEEETDEVERLRRLAEAQNAPKDEARKNSKKNKNKK